MSNLTEHKCAGKCPEFKGDQCHHCLIQQIEKREFELGVAPEDAYVKCGTSQVIDCTGISSKKVELRFKAGEVVVTASPEFKGGDWVVLANSVSRESTLAQILKTDGRWSIIKWLDDNTESDVRLDFLRHATPAEIKAGHRLIPLNSRELETVGDDAHIENHISPLCKTESQPVLIVERDNQIIERLKVENVVLQAKVDELQKQNAWLSGVAERENKRANNLQQDKTSTTILLGKTIQEKNELTKQRDSFIKAYEIEMDERVELQAENKILNQAAATHLRNQNHFMDLYNRLVEQLYPYAIDLEDPDDGDVNTPKEYMDGYNRAREIAHYNLLEMMESDVEYICAQCDMLGGGGEA